MGISVEHKGHQQAIPTCPIEGLGAEYHSPIRASQLNKLERLRVQLRPIRIETIRTVGAYISRIGLWAPPL